MAHPLHLLVILLPVLSTIALPALGEPDARVLSRQFDRAYEAESWEKAAQIAERLAGTEQGAVMGAYNAGCAHSLAGNLDEACDWLVMAAERGFSGVRSFEEDPDLESVRGMDRFEEAYELVKENTAKRLEAFQTLFTETAILTIEPDRFDPDSPVPLLIVLHGAGGTPEPMAELYREIANELGMLLVVPSALRPWGDGFGWTFRDESEWVALHLIERYRESHDIDPERVYIAGFSQGANVALAAGLKYPDRFAGVFPVCGHFDADVMAIAESESRPPIYLMVGAKDPFAKTFREAVGVLKKEGFEVRLRINQGVGHGYPKGSLRELRTGFRFLFAEREESP